MRRARTAAALAAALPLVITLAGCAATTGAVPASGIAMAPAAVSPGTAPPGTAPPALDFDDARHLLTRTGFAPTEDEIERYVGRTRKDAVDALLAPASSAPVVAPPAWTSDPENLLHGQRPRDLTADERKALMHERRARVLELREWWFAEMRATDSPITERMTLFWSNHFATSIQKVRDARLMYAQNALFRREALGNFGTLLHAVTQDPAMLIWLDGARNRRGAPNENYAREVMELFTLGEGHYAQQDVVQAARAFTGLGVERGSGRFVYRPRLHDDGYKTLFGARGDLDADAAIDAILARRETARFIVGKLWREFVSPTPDDTEVAAIADRFRIAHYDIKVALRSLLLSDAFWAAKNRGTLVKSPVELAVGTLRALAFEPRSLKPLVGATTRMGEILFAPPNVRGWPGGDAWITSSTLLARKEFLLRVSRAMPADTSGMHMALDAPGDPSPTAHTDKRGRDARVPIDYTRILLPLPAISTAVPEAIAERDPRAEIRAALLDPVYQLK